MERRNAENVSLGFSVRPGSLGFYLESVEPTNFIKLFYQSEKKHGAEEMPRGQSRRSGVLKTSFYP